VRTRNAQATGRFVTGALIRKSGLVLAALSLLLLFGAGALLDRDLSANASSEPSTLVGYFNQYRASHGLAALSANGTMMSNAQDQAQQNVANCQFGNTYPGHSKPAGVTSTKDWNTYGFNNAAAIWAVYEQDTQVSGWILDSYYTVVGIGLAYNGSCQWGNIWVLDLGHSSGNVATPTPTHTATASPVHTPTHTPSPTPHTPIPTPTPATTTPTPTASPASSGTTTTYPTTPDRGTPTAPGSETPTATASETPIVTGFPTQTPPGTPTPTPAPTPMPEIAGDVTCGGIINLADVLLLLEAAADVGTNAPCMHPTGIDCTGGVDATDALLLLEYIEGIEYFLPDGCPALGSTPTPTPSPTVPAS
jgi:hypothetical protein